MGQFFSIIMSAGANLATRAFTKPGRMAMDTVKATSREIRLAAGANTKVVTETANASKVLPKSMSFETAFMGNTSAGKIFGVGGKLGRGVGGAGSWMGNSWLGKGIGKVWDIMPVGKLAVGTGLGAGIMYGAGSAAMKRIDARNQQTQTGRGMSANYLGTDGLTLALSRRRHRG